MEPGLGRDQVAAVKMLTDEGAGIRCVLAPAGYGKTTMLHAAAQAATAEGRPVVAVATTAKAVAELAGAGLDARTIARLRIDLANGPLGAGTVVVLDEISQTPTREVEAVLAAVDACPGGRLWILGDPRQSQPVGPGGTADHLEQLASSSRIPSARLTVNRRQVDPADRQALDLLRRGEVVRSQELRTERGWEHEHASPSGTRRAMAAAVCEDIDTHGAEAVAALVVSHTDAEDLADRIRARLADAGALGGPLLSGPGWTAERDYQAGDRVLLHARCGPSGSRLVNGTTATVTRVDETGLAVRVNRSGRGGGVAGQLRTGDPQGRLPQPVAFVGPDRRRSPRAAPGRSATCLVAPPWTPTGDTPASPAPASPLTPGTPSNSSLSTTEGSWPTSVTRPKWSPRHWPANPIPAWPPEATPGPSTGNWPTR